jgi:HrpA-like RNA helicase
MDDCAPPEILRTPLTSLVLTLKLLGVSNIAKFKMLTPPPIEALEEALEELYALGAIDENCEIVEGIGDVMAEFPLDAKMGRTVIEGIKIGAAEEVRVLGEKGEGWKGIRSKDGRTQLRTRKMQR